jgi:sigma-B regulation protein RsbU (phosphoserine phosphatase)
MTTLAAGNSRPLYLIDHLFENQLSWLATPYTVIGFGSYGLGIISLVLNTVRAPTPEVRRRTRVILWGLALGPLPFLIVQLVAIVKNVYYYSFPYWIWAPSVLFILLMPAAVAYAVLKHRVLEIPVLLRRSARYFLVQRGFMVLLVVTGAVIVVLAATLLSRAIGPAVETSGGPRVSVALGAALAGVVVAWGLGRVHTRIASRIDRAFFRSAYDARQILEDLIERSRSARDRDELLGLLQQHLDQALQPTSLVVYFRDGDRLMAVTGLSGPMVDGLPADLAGDAPLMAALARHGRPWDTADDSVADLYAAASGLKSVAECLVPVQDREGHVIGLLVLGSRRSEEPYSGEDRRLLAGIAGQMGLSLESFALAEDIARRIETERRVAHEMEIARQVQVNLLPRRPPEVRTLDLAAHCVQARAVGGDFYDYLALGKDHLGLVLADISGKGISAALLMSSLQATLRSRAVELRHDPIGVLQEINRRLIESTEQDQFATLFVGDYDDVSGLLRYVNCGHNPPLLLRRDGRREALAATATVLGAFADWPCATAEVVLEPGDLLVLYSDGVTEAGGEDGEMFGEGRLCELMQAQCKAPIESVLQAVLEAVTNHGNGAAEDDLTLLAARRRIFTGETSRHWI